jgi:hypothetical protein
MGPDVLIQHPSRQPPALNATSDMPVIEVTKPASDAAAAAAKPDASQTTTSAVVQPAAAPTEPPKPAEPAQPADPTIEAAEEAAVVKKPWFIKKIDAANEKARALEQKLQTEAAERARLQDELDARTKSVEVKPEYDPEPAKADYQDPDSYTAELARWNARQEFRKQQETTNREIEKRRTEENQKRAETTIQAIHTAHNKRVEEAKAELPDFDKVALRDDLQVRYDVFFAIEKSPMGPHVMYHIGKNPQVASELNAMEPIDVIRRIVEIEGQIKAQRNKTVTRAAEPIEPLKSSGGTTNSKSPEEMTMAEYEAYLTPILNAERRPNAPTRRQK